MKVSLHRRVYDSLPPQRSRSPLLLVVAAIATTGTMAFAASQLGGEPDSVPSVNPAVSAAEQATRDAVDARIRTRLRSLQRG